MQAMLRMLHREYAELLARCDNYVCMSVTNGFMADEDQVMIGDSLLNSGCVSVMVLPFTKFRSELAGDDFDMVLDYVFIGVKNFEKKEELMDWIYEKSLTLDFQIIE